MERAAERVVLVTGSGELTRGVLAAAATVGRLVEGVAATAVAAHWSAPGAVLVGLDAAAAVADLALPGRRGVYLIGSEAEREALCTWSVPLGAAVLTLPDGARWLSSVLTSTNEDGGRVAVVAVAGGSGGVGATTLAAGLAVCAARQRLSVALVDLDATGGGIDLLLGAEGVPGWRWPRLAGASGQIGSLAERLPLVDGVRLVSMSRTEPCELGAAATVAVVEALERTHDVVILDVGRSMSPAGRAGLEAAARRLVVCGQDVRSVAAARASLQAMPAGRADAVVRLRKGAVVSPGAVADALGLPLLGTVPHDDSIPTAAERGDPPGRAGRREWSRSCLAIVRALIPDVGAAAVSNRALRRWAR